MFQLYRYRCVINRIVDGDTIDVDIDLGYDTWIKNERVRLDGIDCPEIRTTDLVEKEFGFIAARRVEELLPIGSIGYLISNDYDRDGGFGRVLGNFVISGETNLDSEQNTLFVETEKLLTNILLDERHAVLWMPNDRLLMEQNHLDNREWLLDNGSLTDEETQRIRDLLKVNM